MPEDATLPSAPPGARHARHLTSRGLPSIGVQGSFVFGNDRGDASTFDRVCEFAEKTPALQA